MSDDSYGDDFEEYSSEEFDDYVEEPVAVAKPQSLQDITQAENARAAQATRARQQVVEPEYTNKYQISQQKSAKISDVDRRDHIKKDERAKRILQVVELTEEYSDLFSMNPVKSYDMLKRNLAANKVRSVGSQYNEDWQGVEVQTEVIEQSSKKIQVPWTAEDDDDGMQYPSSIKARTVDSSTGPDEDMKTIKYVDPAEYSMARLVKFVSTNGRIMETLLLENSLHHGDEHSEQKNETTLDALSAVATSSTKLALPKELHAHRKVNAMHLSAAFPTLLVVAYGPVVSPPHVMSKPGSKVRSRTDSIDEETKANMSTRRELKHTLSRKGLVCVWDLTSPSAPHKVLYCDGEPSCVSLSEHKNHVVIMGSEAGSLVLWDTREDNVLQQKIASHVCRSPSFSSDALGDANHKSRVVSVVALQERTVPSESANDNAEFDMLALALSHKSSFQLASLEENGDVLIWTVIESKDASLAGSEHEFGIGLGSRVKLIQNTHIPASKLSFASATALVFNPSDTNEFFISQSTGKIARKKRFGDSCSPASYSASSFDSTIDPCYSLAFHPIESTVFVAAFASGVVRLFDIAASEPMYQWVDLSASAIVQVRWVSATCFVALSGDGTFNFVNYYARSAERKKASTQVKPVTTSPRCEFFAAAKHHTDTYVCVATPSPTSAYDESSVHVHTMAGM